MFSQQSSLRPRRTAFVCQPAIAATEAASLGPSKKPQPWIHAYSEPDLFTPTMWTGAPALFKILLPETCSPVITSGVAALALISDVGNMRADIATVANSTHTLSSLTKKARWAAFMPRAVRNLRYALQQSQWNDGRHAGVLWPG